jgi:hypothetical protein
MLVFLHRNLNLLKFLYSVQKETYDKKHFIGENLAKYVNFFIAFGLRRIFFGYDTFLT